MLENIKQQSLVSLMNYRVFKLGLILLYIFATIEIFSYIVLVYLHQKGIVYKPSKVSSYEYAKYLRERDEIVGWPSPQRIDPSLSGHEKNTSYISVYGDSFTEGGNVTYEHTYSSVLSKLLNRRVANYGAGGYGTDQAYIRFYNNIHDNSQIVILGVATENILRNVNSYRTLLSNQSKDQMFGLKPRFIINDKGTLELIPLPKLNYNDFSKLIISPEKYLAYEYFILDGPAGIYKFRFPFTITLLKAITKNFHIRANLRQVPWYKEFYEPGHPSNGLYVTYGIINEFYREAKRRNKKPVILIIPTPLDLLYFEKKKDWSYKNLTKELQKNNIPFIDAGPYMINYLNGGHPRELCQCISGHYNEKGYRILAETVYKELKDRYGFAENLR